MKPGNVPSVSTLPEKTDDLEAQLLLEALYQAYEYDFRGYAKPSITRRLAQARSHLGCRSYSELQDKLLHDPAVLPRLLGFLTVQVSEMFRDPGYFRALRQEVVPHLKTYPSLKVWVAGCGAGEELYSLAILFREEGLEDRTIFYATDVDADALRKAEAGVYGVDRLALFTTNHRRSGAKGSLSEYYHADSRAAVFDKTLRKRTVFANHSLVSDAVFAEVHLISCRNVLIYFGRPLQHRAVGLFRDALARRGFLGLGDKESLRFIGQHEVFEPFVAKERIYRKRGEL
ncbi:CheR family methyltransferase [Candidatus Nitrospira nitrificans]|uniref:Putative methyltransferase Cher3 n=1 Tax=Candidatus Nitrospira nitrificans TaxID=1742973 RepID=A0A0S4LBA8_9BACT|nr:CheR family methyltransferase [Candidatus Nitrospira nitrificans]CUS35025.1 putative methyltransferase Cher3 [Candidatus Nitrospira nitrificans]